MRERRRKKEEEERNKIAHAQTTQSYSSAKLKKMLYVMSPKQTPVSQCILCLIFLMHVRLRTIKSLNYGGQESKE